MADDLKRCPLHCGFFIPEPLELRLAQRNCHVVSVPIVTMEGHQQWLRGGVPNTPHRADDRRNVGRNERPHQRGKSLRADGSAAGGTACAEHDQPRTLEFRQIVH